MPLDVCTRERSDARGNKVRHLARALQFALDEEERGAADGAAEARPVARADRDVGDPRLIFQRQEDGAVRGGWSLAAEQQAGDAGVMSGP